MNISREGKGKEKTGEGPEGETKEEGRTCTEAEGVKASWGRE